MQYIIHTHPNNLEELKLKFSDIAFEKWSTGRWYTRYQRKDGIDVDIFIEVDDNTSHEGKSNFLGHALSDLDFGNR
jgi:hypothetical protein